MLGKRMKKINDLKNVNGGIYQDGSGKHCDKCGTYFSYTQAEKRTAGSRCAEYYQFKCPSCGEWQDPDF